MADITWLNLETGERGDHVSGIALPFARVIVEQLRAERELARDEFTRRYPPIVHGIRRDHASGNSQ